MAFSSKRIVTLAGLPVIDKQSSQHGEKAGWPNTRALHLFCWIFTSYASYVAEGKFVQSFLLLFNFSTMQSVLFLQVECHSRRTMAREYRVLKGTSPEQSWNHLLAVHPLTDVQGLRTGHVFPIRFGDHQGPITSKRCPAPSGHTYTQGWSG